MDLKETGEYIAHHVKLAGRSDTLFSDDAVALIHESPAACPRQVNNLATQTLIAAYVDQQVDLRRELSPRRARRDLRRMTSDADPDRAGRSDAARSPAAGWPAPPDQAAYHGLPARSSKDRAEHRGRPGRDPHPAAGLRAAR